MRSHAALFRSLPLAAYVVDAGSGQLLAVNDAAAETYGYTKAELLSMSVADLSGDSAWRRLRAQFPRHAESSGFTARLRHRSKDGADRSGAITARQITFGRRQAWLLSVSAAASGDRSAAALRDSRRRFRMVFEHALDGILMADEEARLLDANPAACSLLGYSCDELKRMTIWQLTPPELVSAGQRAFKRLLVRGVQNGHYQIRCRDGSVKVIQYRAVARALRGVHFAVMRDVTERTEGAEELRRSGERFRQLSARSRALREEERTRLARELHDQLGQALSAIKMDLAFLGGLTERFEVTTAQSMINRMLSQIDDTIAVVRRISTELRPAVLDRLGLVAAIQWQAEDFERRTGVRCRLSGSQGDLPLDKNQATGVFRILQEVLTNVSRHARASAVTITLWRAKHQLGLFVVDNGCGIETERIHSDGSLGLVGMRERAALLGGSVVISRHAKGGTVVRVVVPYKPRMIDTSARAAGAGKGSP